MGRRLHGDFRSGEVAPIWHRSDLTGCSVVSVETHARAVALLLIAPNVPVRAGCSIRRPARGPIDAPAVASPFASQLVVSATTIYV